jgi:hypothetical protein
MPRTMSDAVRAFFAAEDWPVADGPDEGVLETAFEGTTTAWPCRVHVFDEDHRLVFISAFPALVDDERRPAIGEFCNRANFGLAVGNFELDHEGGEVRFRTSLDTEGSEPDEALVRNAVVANVLTMDRYAPGLLAVLNGTDPADAVDDVEDADEEDAE